MKQKKNRRLAVDLLIPLMVAGAALSPFKAGAVKLTEHSSFTAFADTDKNKAAGQNLFVQNTGNVVLSDSTQTYMISGSVYGVATDSLNYVINGKKSTKAEFSKLDIKNIEALHLIAPENAATLTTKFDHPYNVLFVTTANCAEGKALLPKLEKICRDHAFVMGYSGKGETTGSVNKKLTGDKKRNPDDFTIAGTGTLVSMDPTAHFQAMDLRPVTGRVNIVYPTGDTSYVIAANKKVHLINGKTTKAYSFSSNGAAVTNFSSDNVYVTSRSGSKVMVYGGNGRGESVDNLNDKLIFINDKEATESDLKKLSAFDIEKMTVKSDYDTKQKFGDKAKNGVLYFYTKKDKN